MNKLDFFDKLINLLFASMNSLMMWAKHYIFDIQFLFQILAFIGLVLGLNILCRRVSVLGKKYIDKKMITTFHQTLNIQYDELFFIIALPLFTHIGSEIMSLMQLKINFFEVLTPLMVAWSVIRIFQNLFDNSKTGRFVFWMVWGVAALNMSGYAKDVTKFLKKIAITVGTYKITLLGVFESIIIFTFIFWIATLLVKLFSRRLEISNTLSGSEKVLLKKGAKILLYGVSFLYALNLIGVDLTTITVFSGAIGFGLGFGLKQIISNFISGIILLLDKSIKPGDIIAFDQTFGKVTNLESRYVSIEALDGKKILIPNEFLVNNKVENWSFGHKKVCLGVPVGVSYNADLEGIKKVMLDIAAANRHVLSDPKPIILFRKFGDSTIDLELRAWIEDPAHGYASIKSDLFFEIWKTFKEKGVVIPYPQQDIHIKSSV